jgi:hypothetical protein
MLSSFSHALFSHSLALFFCLCLSSSSFCTLSSFCALSCGMCLSCMLLSFLCALSLYLGFSPNIVSKTACPTGPQHSPVARPEPLRPVSVLPCRNEVLRGSLSDLYLFENCGLCCCYLLYGLRGQVCEFVLCFHHCLFDLTLNSGQFSNDPYCFFLSLVLVSVEGYFVGPSVSPLLHMPVTEPKWFPYALLVAV